jgi:hypothetical protein
LKRLVPFLLVLSLAVRADGAPQSKPQQVCINSLDAAGLTIAQRVTRNAIGCVTRAVGAGLPVGQTVAQCLAADPGKRIERVAKRCAAIESKKCPTKPDFGASSAAAIDAAARKTTWLTDVFGADLDTALGTSTDPAVRKCRMLVTRGAGHVFLARLQAFGKCAKSGLKGGTIVDAATLGACTDTDPTGAVARASAALERAVSKRCVSIDVASAFPGACAASTPATLASCLGPQTRCRACLVANDAAGFLAPCHRYTHGIATPYCGERPATTESVARQWDEAALAAIRIDLPRPPIHARNLYHLAAVMWDAWAAYDPNTDGVFSTEKATSSNVETDRATAISFAAYRLLSERYALSVNADASETALAALMADLGYDVGYTSKDENDAAALGNRIAALAIDLGLADGSNEASNYADPTYVAVNDPLIVKLPGTTMVDPNHWQPLALDSMVGQNGIPIPGKVQVYVGPQWGAVTPFAVDFPGILPAPPPHIEDGAPFKQAAVDVLQLAGELTPDGSPLIDISPASIGNNPLGTNDGTGYSTNPVTGQPYAPQMVKRGDFGRVLAEFWADGPTSETPPGHWNTIANYVSDHIAEKRIGGVGSVVSDLEWDVKTYLVLNGATHDAAVGCWGTKRVYDSVRPISMVRYMGGLGQSTDGAGPSYAPNGLPLVPGVIEVITAQSSAPGERHEALAPYVGEIAVLSWPGEPADVTTQYSGVRWVRAKQWVPYQRKTFVTPAFPGYISGHSTFSRAAAEALTQLTGSPYFPGGLGEFTAPKNAFLKFEIGPSETVVLQWATYYDAADQAGQSRIWGGIHIRADDFGGRIMGATIGADAWDKAVAYFDGTARP